jgi:bifunctional non-homologous end joining protein LigD
MSRASLPLLRIPEPMLARPGALPSGPAWSFELKWDGFRALVSTEAGLRVRSRRGWNMTPVLPELRRLPKGLVLDGELVAWKGKEPWFPNLRRRMLNSDMSVPVTFVAFDLLRIDGTDLIERTYCERRDRLVSLGLDGPGWATSETFEDGPALYASVCELGLEGVVAKKHSGRYRPGERGWVKTKNPNWRRKSGVEGVRRFDERRLARP